MFLFLSSKFSNFAAQKKAQQSAELYKVRMIGVEPTRREALAPETSVSTISPLGLFQRECKDIKCF